MQLSENSPRHLGLNGAQLKLFAIVTMLIDHCGLAIVYYGLLHSTNPALTTRQDLLWDIYHLMRDIGRTAFPVFLFLLVQGFIHTHDRKAYAKRLFIFGILSEIPFDLCIDQKLFSVAHQNVMWSLLFGFLMMWGLDYISRREIPETMKFLLGLVVIAAAALSAWGLHTDYRYKGILILAVLYFVRFDKKLTLVALVVCFLWEPAAIFAAIPVAFYNGQRGNMPKHFFYWFYPVHLLALYLLQCAILVLLR